MDPSEHSHETERVDETTILESRDVRTVTAACTREGCNYRLQSVVVGGDRATTVEGCHDLAVELYESLYDQPRGVSYFTLAQLVGDHEGDETGAHSGHLPILDWLAEAVDLGVEDAQADREPREREAVLEAIGHAYPFQREG